MLTDRPIFPARSHAHAHAHAHARTHAHTHTQGGQEYAKRVEARELAKVLAAENASVDQNPNAAPVSASEKKEQ